MRKIYDWIENLPKDKVLHFLVTFVISFVSCFIICKHTNSLWSGIAGSWFLAFAIGVGKEILDEQYHHNADEADWFADVLGYVSAIVIYIIASIA